MKSIPFFFTTSKSNIFLDFLTMKKKIEKRVLGQRFAKKLIIRFWFKRINTTPHKFFLLIRLLFKSVYNNNIWWLIFTNNCIVFSFVVVVIVESVHTYRYQYEFSVKFFKYLLFRFWIIMMIFLSIKNASTFKI